MLTPGPLPVKVAVRPGPRYYHHDLNAISPYPSCPCLRATIPS